MKYAHTKPKNYVSLRASIEEARNRGGKTRFQKKSKGAGGRRAVKLFYLTCKLANKCSKWGSSGRFRLPELVDVGVSDELSE